MASLDSTNSITKTMKESLYGSEALPKQNIIIPGNDGVETTVTASGDTYTITVKIQIQRLQCLEEQRTYQ